MINRDKLWYIMILSDIVWYYLIFCDISWYIMIYHDNSMLKSMSHYFCPIKHVVFVCCSKSFLAISPALIRNRARHWTFNFESFDDRLQAWRWVVTVSPRGWTSSPPRLHRVNGRRLGRTHRTALRQGCLPLGWHLLKHYLEMGYSLQYSSWWSWDRYWILLLCHQKGACLRLGCHWSPQSLAFLEVSLFYKLVCLDSLSDETATFQVHARASKAKHCFNAITASFSATYKEQIFDFWDSLKGEHAYILLTFIRY